MWAELKDNPLTVGIAKYDKDGNFIYSIPATLFGGSNSTGSGPSTSSG